MFLTTDYSLAVKDGQDTVDVISDVIISQLLKKRLNREFVTDCCKYVGFCWFAEMHKKRQAVTKKEHWAYL